MVDNFNRLGLRIPHFVTSLTLKFIEPGQSENFFQFKLPEQIDYFDFILFLRRFI